MDKFLKIHKQLKLTQDETDNLNSPIFKKKKLYLELKKILKISLQAQVISLINYSRHLRKN